jgi:polyhydroxyalkanoate synthesis regulator phasin
MIDGIHTDSKYAGASGVGFTTKEYEKFLSETLNGTDVINLGQATYFARLFSAMSDKFIKNGNVTPERLEYNKEVRKALLKKIRNREKEANEQVRDIVKAEKRKEAAKHAKFHVSEQL